jgi:hypothetical protein
MATGQTLLDTMELLNQELQLQSGEDDVTRGLVALNRAQDYFESILAGERGVLGDQTGTVTTANDTESTSFPTGLLRLDSLWRLDSNSRPVYELDPVQDTGGHADNWEWPVSLVNSYSPGTPTAYWTNGRSIYWSPRPDATYTIRWYGLQSASDISAGGTFAYDDVVILPLASFAGRLMKIGVEDDATDLGTLAENTFRPVIKALSNFNRTGPKRLRYRYTHEA